MKFASVSSVAALSLLAVAGAANAQVYFNDFNAGPIGGEWSTSVTETSPSGQRFLGTLGAGTVTLNLGTMTAGNYTLDFDFYAIRSLDGNGPAGGGPDFFQFQMGAQLLALTNFDNYGASTQQFPSPTPATNAPGTGALALNSLGYTFAGAQFADAIYHFSFNVTHAGGNLSFLFISLQNQDIGDEAWGLDNVAVVPAPGAAAGLLGLSAVAMRRRRR